MYLGEYYPTKQPILGLHAKLCTCQNWDATNDTTIVTITKTKNLSKKSLKIGINMH